MKTLLTLHASMTDPTQALTFRDIDRRDRQHGFSKVGYHFVIERDGKTTPGRTANEASLHDSLRLAKDAVSVLLIGGADEHGNPTNNFTDEQRDALVHLGVGIRQYSQVQKVKAVTLAITDHEASRWVGLPY